MIGFDVRLNGGTQVGHVEIHRLEGRNEMDAVNTYEATFEWINHGEVFAARKRRVHVTFEHRYGDPWPTMLHRVLHALEVFTGEGGR